MKKFKVVSLFAGCGGLDLGFKGGFEFLGNKYARNNFEVVWANDFEPRACDTLKLNFPETEVVCGDIVSILKSNTEIPAADIVLGGFPCQEFSLAGKRRGFKTKKGRLYLSMLETINRLQPKAFVAENVKGLLSIHNGEAIKTIEEDFAEAGYNVTKHLYLAADYGVPQMRERVMIVGIKKSLGKEFIPPQPTHSQVAEPGKKRWVGLKQAIGDLESIKVLQSLPNFGFSQAKMFPGTQGNTITKSDKPGPTMRAEHHGNIEFHYNGDRRLAVREAARIQSFPDDFVFVKSNSDAYRQIGNAVPPVLGWHVARQLQKILS